MSERAVRSGTACWAPRQALADTGRTDHECRDGKTRGGMIAVDFIEIEALRLRCVLGGTEQERRDRQDVVISMQIGTDTRAAAGSDRVRTPGTTARPPRR
jgi:hypothetical protein